MGAGAWGSTCWASLTQTPQPLSATDGARGKAVDADVLGAPLHSQVPRHRICRGGRLCKGEEAARPSGVSRTWWGRSFIGTPVGLRGREELQRADQGGACTHGRLGRACMHWSTCPGRPGLQ